jgi:predicted PurR-regulated permease PerM
MEKLAEKINLVIVSLLLLLASVIFFASVIRGQVLIGILAGCLTWIGSRILKITIDESRN